MRILNWIQNPDYAPYLGNTYTGIEWLEWVDTTWWVEISISAVETQNLCIS